MTTSNKSLRGKHRMVVPPLPGMANLNRTAASSPPRRNDPAAMDPAFSCRISRAAVQTSTGAIRLA